MSQAKPGDKVRVHYTGKLVDGTVFDTSTQGEPLQFTLGEREVIPGLDEAVVGMNPGETKQALIPANQAFGPHHKERVMVVDRSELPTGAQAEVGQPLQIRQSSGEPIPARITAVSPSAVTVDATHPLAGKDLRFDLQLVEVL